ncbi:MAG: stage III sporulation protein AA [Oscillospiraceae bacterium]|nr:stage III sporulation protein AA [Oscillospiraceae bacterium]
MITQRRIIKEATAFLPDVLRFPIGAISENVLCEIKEIRLKRKTPVCIVTSNNKLFLKFDGTVVADAEQAGLCIVENADMDDAVRRLCNYSVHAFQNEMKNGFITVAGGHRVGISASAIINAQGDMSAVRNVSSLNIRIAREVEGAADELIREVLREKIRSVLIVGEPSSGKTTVLRDVAKRLSEKEFGYMRVCIVDERGEISATSEGVNRMALGVGCDVLDGYPKAEGMMIALRAMSPDIIVCDEIGSSEDVASIESIANAGVKLIATIHANSFSQLSRRPQFSKLMQISAFDVAVILSGKNNPGKIKEIVSLKRHWR